MDIMRRVLARVTRAFDEGVTIARAQGVAAVWRWLCRSLWHRSSTRLYAGGPGQGECLPPDGILIRRFTDANRDQAMSDIGAAGAGEDVRFLSQGAVCYLAYDRKVPVAVGWSFSSSRLLKRARLDDGLYLCGFHVVKAARGRGLYPLLLRTMVAEAGGRICYADVDPRNNASIRGLEKAEFRELGTLHVCSLAGIILRCKLVPAME